jgi:hypothetical protein
VVRERYDLTASLASLVPRSGKPPANTPFEKLSVSGENRDGGKAGGEGIAGASDIGARGPTLNGPDTGSVPSRIHSTLGSGYRESTEGAEDGKYPVGGDKNGGDSDDGEDEELDDDEEDEEPDDEVEGAGTLDEGGAISAYKRPAHNARGGTCTAGRFTPLGTMQGTQGTPTGAEGGMVTSGGALSD